MTASELFQANIKRAEELVSVHKNNFPKGRPVSKGVPADLLRAVVVMAVAALDSYIHRRIAEVLHTIMTRKKHVPDKIVRLISKQFKEETLPREFLKISLVKHPDRRIESLAGKGLGIKTFQSPEELTEAFEMMEIRNPWEKIRKTIHRAKPGKKKKGIYFSPRVLVRDLCKRRNDIVHEGDVYLGKKHHGGLKPISRSQVTKWTKRLRLLIQGAEELVAKEHAA